MKTPLSMVEVLMLIEQLGGEGKVEILASVRLSDDDPWIPIRTVDSLVKVMQWDNPIEVYEVRRIEE